MMQSKTVSVIIPTYKPNAEELSELIRRLEVQTLPPERILLVNTEEAFFPKEVSEELLSKKHVQVLHIGKKEFDHGGTRDLAARMMKSDYLLFMTMDAIPADKNLIRNLAEAFEDPTVGAAYARQLPKKKASALERYTRGFNYGEESIVKGKEDLEKLGIKTFFCSNVCAMYRRNLYLELGGFETKTIFNEDMIFAGHLVLADFKIAYCAGACVYHSHNYSGIMQFKRNFDLGVSQAEHPEIFQITSSESEGIRMIRRLTGWLLKTGRFYLIPKMVWQNGCKFLGYRLGKKYRKLPLPLIRRISLNPSYWE